GSGTVRVLSLRIHHEASTDRERLAVRALAAFHLRVLHDPKGRNFRHSATFRRGKRPASKPTRIWKSQRAWRAVEVDVRFAEFYGREAFRVGAHSHKLLHPGHAFHDSRVLER